MSSKLVTLAVGNIHCPSCVATIESLLSEDLGLSRVNVALLSGAVSFLLPTATSKQTLANVCNALRGAGFDVADDNSHANESTLTVDSSPHTSGRLARWFQTKASVAAQELERAADEERRAQAHKASCKACREEELIDAQGAKGKAKGSLHEFEVVIGGANDERVTVIGITGMTCSSCVSNVTSILSPDSDARIRERTVTLLPGRAIIKHSASLAPEVLAEMIEEGGYDAAIVESKLVVDKPAAPDKQGLVESKFVLSGMTCSSCIEGVAKLLTPANLAGLRSAAVTLLPPIAVVIHDSRALAPARIMEEIEDAGFGAELVSTIDLDNTAAAGEREVKLRVDGMFCGKCSTAINRLLEGLHAAGTIASFTPLEFELPVTTITYVPSPPDGFTLRTLRSQIADLGPFTIHPIKANDTLDDLARKAQGREARALAVRVGITFLFAIPTFLIAVVAMSLLAPTHPLRRYFEASLVGSASRGTIALWILATPVQFGIGAMFYTRAWKGVKGVWRRGGADKWKNRLLRWGSMDTLVALGTTTAYVASFVFMVMDMTRPQTPDGMSSPMTYYDASVFLILFILAGRLLEGTAKKRTGDAVSALGMMKPVTGLLYSGHVENQQAEFDAKLGTEAEFADLYESTSNLPALLSASTPASTSAAGTQVEADFIEVGDILLIPLGSAVPLDSVLLATSSTSSFDESSLTGESLPLLKHGGDAVFAGSMNLGPSAVIVRVTKASGETMIDGIVSVVRDAMSRKASIERLADTVTGYFVPAIVGIAAFTLIVWLLRGYSGNLPIEWLDGQGGSWTLFAVQFAVSVLVVSCPCGIGLAAPTAQMVGTGIAARLGIVPYGGGEAFQNATKIDCVVFDKTGTLTSSLFTVADHFLLPVSDATLDASTTNTDAPGPSLVQLAAATPTLWKVLEVVEEASSHPISVGIRSFCRAQLASSPVRPTSITLCDSTETPGRGLTAELLLDGKRIKVIVGNAAFMAESEATYGQSIATSDQVHMLLDTWGSRGQSVVLVAIAPWAEGSELQYQVVALFGVEDPVREEAAYVINELENQGICVFICSGDNPKTTLSVAGKLGVAPDQVFAGVLPMDKKECVERLQRGAAAEQIKRVRGKRVWWKRLLFRRDASVLSAKVMFVGDGINDLVALTQADVGVSMGSGASVALSTSDFCLLSSSLLSLLTLLSLARATFNKIISNFIWASLFNGLLIPVAAGAFYSLGRTTLPPVWASLAMALSSVSVVSNSLLLRWTFRAPAAVRHFQTRLEKREAV